MSTMGYVTTLTGAEDAANLSLDFEKQSYKVMEGGKQGSKSFNDLLTFSRTTTGGRFNEKGLYESVPINQPRFDYDPITKVLKGLLVEEQRTNLVKDSNITSFATGWTKVAGVVIGSPTLAPDGVSAAVSIANTPNVSSYMQQVGVIPAEGVHTFSFFCKPEPGFQFSVVFELAGIISFNAVTKTFSGGTPTSASYTDLPDGWIRVSITSSATKLAFYIGVYGTTAVQHKGYIWGMQVEAASSSTSYIQTQPTFTSRASTATYFDKNGMLQTAGLNVARSSTYTHDINGNLLQLGLQIESSSTNLIKKAGDAMNIAPWGSAGVTITRASGIDGGFTANKIVEDIVTSVKEVRQSLAISVTAGTTYTFSVYAKSLSVGADRQIRIGFGNGSVVTGGAQAVFNLKDHTLASVDNGTVLIQKIGNGWARYSYTVTATNTSTPSIYLTLLVLGGAGYQGDGVSGCYVYGSQVEVGSSATSYIKAGGTFTSRSTTATYLDSNGTLQTAGVNVARDNSYDYDETGILKPIGLLLESQSTNLLSYSQDYTSGNWGNVGPGTLPLALTAGASNGTRGANTMTLMARQDLGVKYLSKAFTAGAGTIITRTQRVKAVDSSPVGTCLTMRLQTESYANRVDAWFNLATGECAAQKIGDCQLLGVSMVKERDGVWLCTLTGKSGVGAWGSVGMSVLDKAGTTDSTPIELCSAYVDCAQVEIGAVATSYIPTTTTTVTRTADVFNPVTTTRATDLFTAAAATRSFDEAVITDLSTWYNFTEGTLDVTFTPGQVGVGGTTVAYYMRTTADAAKDVVSCRRNSAGTITTVITDNAGVNQAVLDGLTGTLPNTRLHVSTAIKKDNFAISVNGRTAVLDPFGNTPNPQRVYLGNAGSGTQNANGYINKFSFYPIRLANNQIESLSN